MPHMYDLQLRDFSNEVSTHQINIGPITLATLTGTLTRVATYRSAVEGISLGIVAKEKIVMDDTVISAARPPNAFAQRELKFLVRYHGVGDGKHFQSEIACPDLSDVDILIPGTDIVDLTFPAVATFKTAFEAFAVPPNNDVGTVVLDEMIIVGRNL